MGPRRWRELGGLLPFGGAFAVGGLEVDDPLAPVGKDTEGHRDGTPDGVGGGPARRHHAVGHGALQRSVRVRR